MSPVQVAVLIPTLIAVGALIGMGAARLKLAYLRYEYRKSKGLQ